MDLQTINIEIHLSNFHSQHLFTLVIVTQESELNVYRVILLEPYNIWTG